MDPPTFVPPIPLSFRSTLIVIGLNVRLLSQCCDKTIVVPLLMHLCMPNFNLQSNFVHHDLFHNCILCYSTIIEFIVILGLL